MDFSDKYARPMSIYLVSLFNRAGRPRMTEGENYDYLVRASVVEGPSLVPISASGMGIFFLRNFLEFS